MKVFKTYLFGFFVLIISANVALATEYRLMGVGFAAPELSGTGSVPNPEIGAIILNSVDSTFYGYTGSSWIPFSGIGTASANTVYAGPTSGGSGAPAFRALVNADLPSIVKMKVVT